MVGEGVKGKRRRSRGEDIHGNEHGLTGSTRVGVFPLAEFFKNTFPAAGIIES